MITAYVCIGATFRRVYVLGASPWGIKVQIEDEVMAGDPVTLTHKHLPPIEGHVTWVKDELARIEFTEALDERLLHIWFGEVL